MPTNMKRAREALRNQAKMLRKLERTKRSLGVRGSDSGHEPISIKYKTSMASEGSRDRSK